MKQPSLGWLVLLFAATLFLSGVLTGAILMHFSKNTVYVCGGVK